MSSAQRATLPVLVLLSASPALLPTGSAPVVTARAELWAVAVAGIVALVLGARSWQQAPLQVAAFESPDARQSPWPQLLVGAAALAGALSALIGVLEVLAPQVLAGALGHGAQPSPDSSRAVGPMRQPNHLATALLWGAVAWAVLHAQARLPKGWGTLGMAVFMLAVVLSGSRTGLLGVAILPLWGLVDRRLPRATRILLALAPLMAALCWWALHRWATLGGMELGVVTRFNGADGGELSSGRLAIWANSLELIAQQPWTGVGLGHFNIAWTLTPLPGRPSEAFSHAHNLPLHLVTELGLVLGLAVCVSGLVMLGLAAKRAWAHEGPTRQAVCRRGAWIMLLVVGWHSLLEYPLWYAYFSLPAALALVVCFGLDRPFKRAARWQALILMMGGTVMLTLAAWAYADFRSIRSIYQPGRDAGPLSQRIAQGQQATWFSDHAHYARATTLKPVPGQAWDEATEHAFHRAAHVLLDPRLMMAWADALAARDAPSDRDRARYLAARLREFHAPSAQAWLQACDDPQAPTSRRFVCETPEKAWTWRDFGWP